MLSAQQQNSQFLITKEVFIDHIPCQIEQHYEINPKCLGAGGFGQVFQAKKKKKMPEYLKDNDLGTSFSSLETCQKEEEKQENSGQTRAIKMIGFQNITDKEKMRNQIEILSYLDHPSILKLYETYEYKKRLYLVTDLLKGGDLFSIIEEKREADQQDIKFIFEQLIKALCYLHSQNICHRDIKLQNILFLDEKTFNIKIIDFGLAYCWEDDMRKEIKSDGQYKRLAGTPDYMSPEMLNHDYDQRCDIWSAGVILYMLLTKVPPFPGSNDKQIMDKIKKLDFSLQIPEMENVSKQAKDLLSKILVPQDERISIEEILDHEWFTIQSCICQKCSSEAYSTKSINSTYKSIESTRERFQNKFRSTRSYDRVKKQAFLNNSDRKSQSQFPCKRHYSQDLSLEDAPEHLTVQKMEYYCGLPKLQKLISIYSVSKLSELKTQNYGLEYMIIDKNSDGVISLEDLTEYLFEMENYCDKEKTQYLFKGLALSQRGYISYTQYLACVLSYQSIFKHKNVLNNSQDDELDQRFSYTGGIQYDDDSLSLESVDIYEDNILYDLFLSLDKDNDGYITKTDFITLLQNSGIEEHNTQLIKEIEIKFNETFNKKLTEKEDEEEKIEQDQEYVQDHRKFKRYLSRTYKGEKDGGIPLTFEMFKSLIKDHEKLLKETIVVWFQNNTTIT